MLNRASRLIIRLYPTAWRARYGEEFDALLEDAPPRWRDLLDIMTGALTMQLSDHRFWTRTALAGLAGLIIAFGLWVAQPAYYTSTATIQSPNPESLVYVPAKALSRTSLFELITRYDLYPNEMRRLPAEDVVEGMKRDLHITPYGEHSSAFTVQFQYPDRVKAQAVVSDLTKHMSILSAPSAPESAARRWNAVLLMAGLAVGLLAGIIIQEPWRWTLQMAGFGLAGLALVLAASQLIPDRYIASALVLGDVTLPASSSIAVQELTPGSGNKVYLLSIADTDRYRAQRTLNESILASRPQIHVIDPPSLPFLPVSPNRYTLALLGALAGIGFGLWRIHRPWRTIPG